MLLKAEKLKKEIPISPVLEMIENRYKDFKSLLQDLGDEVSNLAIINYNEALFNLLLTSSKKTIKFLENNNIELIKETFKSFIKYILENELLEHVFLSSNCVEFTSYTLNQRVIFRVPYCSVSNDLKCVKEGELPKQEDIKMDLTLFQDFGNYSQKFIEYTLEYIKQHKLTANNKEHKKVIFEGVSVLFVTESFNKDIIEIVCNSGGVNTFECIKLLDKDNITKKLNKKRKHKRKKVQTRKIKNREIIKSKTKSFVIKQPLIKY